MEVAILKLFDLSLKEVKIRKTLIEVLDQKV